jgi:hypothetical protein
MGNNSLQASKNASRALKRYDNHKLCRTNEHGHLHTLKENVLQPWLTEHWIDLIQSW